MKKKWLTYDLQFFADGEGGDEGAEESEAAEQTEEETEESEETEDEQGESEEEDRDAIYAAARRRAESEARARYDKAQADKDAFYANLCRGRVNPETGAPITTEAEYIEALNAQERVSVQSELQSKGVDPSVIDRYIANNPEIQQSRRMIAELQQREVQTQIQEDVKAIMALDKSYESEDDLVNSDSFKAAVEMCQKTPGLRVQDAYKLVNFEALRSAGVKAAKQSAINEAKGKGHLVSTPNTPTGKGSVEIPEEDLPRWKKMFPDRPRKELNAIYAKVKSH